MTIDDLNLWKTFLAVAHEGSFTKAAKIVKTNPPGVAKRIAQLEAMLEVRLFNRTTRVVRLTDEGTRLVPEAMELLERARAIEERVRESKQVSGVIRLTCLTGLASRWLAPAIVEFSRRHPDVKFEVLATDRIVDLVQEGVDLAIRIQEPKGSDHVFRELQPNELVVVASPKYLKSAKPIRAPKDLHHHPLLTLDVHRDIRFKKTGERLGEFEDSKFIRCESGPYLTDLALLGAGVAVRARYDVSPFLRDGKLVQVLAKHPLEYFRKVYLVIPQRRYLAPRVRLFADFLISRREITSPSEP